MKFFDKLLGSKDNEGNNKQSANALQWQTLSTEAELAAIIERSATVPCAIFKHSTRCSISSMAKGRLERQWDVPQNELEIYYLDLIRYRNVSNRIAEQLAVEHQSPQILLLKNGKCVYNTSHSGINVADLKAAL